MAFTLPTGTIKLVGEFADVKKIFVSTNPRAFPTGSLLWLNKVSGRYQAEPFLLSTTAASVDASSANGTTYASTYTTAALLAAAMEGLFLGVAAEGRIAQQLNPFGLFGCAGQTQNYAQDASTPFISYYDAGIFTMPVGLDMSSTGALTAAIEPGTAVMPSCFANEATNGFYDPSGCLQKDTDYYAVNNAVYAPATDTTHAIGIVVERAPIGQTWLKVKLKAYGFNVAVG